MLNGIAFASSLTILSAVSYMVLYLLAVVWREGFRFLFNAQFFGADVASLLPQQLTVSSFLGTLLALIVFSWVFSYAWAWLYNAMSQRAS